MIRPMSHNEVKALHYELLMKDILASAEKLPPFPDVAWKVLSLIRKTAPVNEIEDVIRYDPIITARVISLSQSPLYGRRHKIASLSDAIFILGNQKLIQVIMASCAARYFFGGKAGINSTERQLWEHSVATAVLGEMLAQGFKMKRVLTVYTASLLHDIGKTILNQYSRVFMQSQFQDGKLEGANFVSAERSTLGIDHQELGEKIARRWRFPEEITSAIGCHHCPDKAKTDKDIAYVVYAANRIVNAMDEEQAQMNPFVPEEDSAFIHLGLSQSIVANLQRRLTESLEGIQQFLTSDN
jgi:putative nucleotidyltransferase with HDIG domain